MNQKDWYIPLMSDPIRKADILALKEFLNENDIPRLSNGPKIEEAEKAFAEWLGVKYAVIVNSGSSANELTMMGIREMYGQCSVLVPPLTWVSDWAAILHAGLTPITCDINLTNLSFDLEKLKSVVREDTKVIFLTHVLGICGITQELLDFCKERSILLIEDVCESAGATFNNVKLGNFGFAANWSGFVAHHFSGIEMGIITTNDEGFYEYMRALRSHGMNRELKNEKLRQWNIDQNPQLNKDFIFLAAAHNFRATEIQGVLLLSQLKKLDDNNEFRKKTFRYFIGHLNPEKYHVKLNLEGQCAYSFIIILKESNTDKWAKVEEALSGNLIEFRRGLSGGGSQLKQPYLNGVLKSKDEDFPNMLHIHSNSCYVGLYPGLKKSKIDNLLRILNSLDV